MLEKNKFELGQDTLAGVAGGFYYISPEIERRAIDQYMRKHNLNADTKNTQPAKTPSANPSGGGTPTQTTSEPPVTPTANPGGPNYNNDNRGGKQMNVQMGNNVNSSSGNKM